MNLLLGTHTFLWMSLDDPQLSQQARDLIADTDNQILLSPASYCEIVIKIRLGKYQLDESLHEFVNRELKTIGWRASTLSPHMQPNSPSTLFTPLTAIAATDMRPHKPCKATALAMLTTMVADLGSARQLYCRCCPIPFAMPHEGPTSTPPRAHTSRQGTGLLHSPLPFV